MNNPETPPKQQIVTAKKARGAAGLFNIGNIISMLLPFPVGIFWVGFSMVVYAMNRHHPNEKVGYYTQQAAYRFYGVVGFVVVVAIFFGTELRYWLVTWAICAGILIPWSIFDLIRIRKDNWQDCYFGENNNEQDSREQQKEDVE